jgi:hypothetical protein
MKTIVAYAATWLAATLFPIAARAQGPQNLLAGFPQWSFTHSPGTTGTITPTQDGVQIAVQNASGMRSACFEQTHVALVLGETYHFHCLISAQTDSPVEVGLVPSNGGRMQDAQVQTITVTPNWDAVDMDFTADGIGMNDITVAFYLGGASTLYRFSGASLVDENGAVPLPATPAPAPPPANMPAPNGWALELAGRAQAGTVSSADGPIIDVDQPDGNAGDVAFARDNVDVANGTTYVVHFRARSASERTIHVEADDMTSRTPVGLTQDAQITPLWQDFNLTFTAKGATSGKARIALMLGGTSGTIEIAAADFSNPNAMSGNAGPSAQVAQAPDLGGLHPVATWDLDTQGSTEAMVTPAPTGAVVEIDRTDGQPAHVILKQDGIGLADGKMYELHFKAKSTIARQIPIIAQVDGGPGGSNFQMVGCNDAVHMTPEWQDYVVKFTAIGTVPDHSRIAFLLGGQASTVELSDVALHADDTPAQTASNRE